MQNHLCQSSSLEFANMLPNSLDRVPKLKIELYIPSKESYRKHKTNNSSRKLYDHPQNTD